MGGSGPLGPDPSLLSPFRHKKKRKKEREATPREELFASLFRFPALLIGIGVPFFAAFRLKKARSGSRLPSWIGTIAMLGLWVVLSAAAWMGMFVLPLLFRYDVASVSALAITVVHVAIGAWLVKRWLAPKLAAFS